MRMKRVLLIDDNPADRDLLMRHLCRSYDAIDCVEIFRRQDFEAALAQGGFDVVITDSTPMGRWAVDSSSVLEEPSRYSGDYVHGFRQRRDCCGRDEGGAERLRAQEPPRSARRRRAGKHRKSQYAARSPRG